MKAFVSAAAQARESRFVASVKVVACEELLRRKPVYYALDMINDCVAIAFIMKACQI